MSTDISHLLLIPDGHRRYARANNTSFKESYQIAAEFGLNIVSNIYHHNIKEFSLFLISERTLKRNNQVLKEIFSALNHFLTNLNKLICAGMIDLSINHFGDKSLLPIETSNLIDLCISKKSESKHTLNLLICYSGTKSLLNNVSELSNLKGLNNSIGESMKFNEYLNSCPHTLSKIELVVRCGQYFRLSDAPLLETLNSVCVSTQKTFPEMKLEDITSILDRYFHFKDRKMRESNGDGL